jgi:hypothetical protein
MPEFFFSTYLKQAEITIFAQDKLAFLVTMTVYCSQNLKTLKKI